MVFFCLWLNVKYQIRQMTLYVCEKKLSDVQKKLESESSILFEWFRDN